MCQDAVVDSVGEFWRITSLRSFLGYLEQTTSLENDTRATPSPSHSATAKYRFASPLPAINPFDAITNFRGQNAPSFPSSLLPIHSSSLAASRVITLSLPFRFEPRLPAVKRISDAKFTQFTASRN